MAKWLGRILYILFAIFVVFVVEFFFGGIVEIQKSLYASDYLMAAVDEDGSYKVFDGMSYYNAPYNYYYSKNKIKTLDGALSYDNSNDVTDEKYQVALGIYPFVSAETAPGYDIYRDGFYIVLEDSHEDVMYYSFDIAAYHIADTDKTKVNLNDGTKHTIWKTPNGFLANNQVPYTLRVTNFHLYRETQESLGGIYEYNVSYINVYAHMAEGDPVLIYRLTDGTETYAGEPLATHTNLNLNAETYNISKTFENPLAPNADEIASNNLDNRFQPADLSGYINVYIVVYIIYFLVLIVVPYFWFFHRRVMANYRKKKGYDVTSVPVDHKPEEQLFQDLQPSEEEKKSKRK